MFTFQTLVRKVMSNVSMLFLYSELNDRVAAQDDSGPFDGWVVNERSAGCWETNL